MSVNWDVTNKLGKWGEDRRRDRRRTCGIPLGEVFGNILTVPRDK